MRVFSLMTAKRSSLRLEWIPWIVLLTCSAASSCVEALDFAGVLHRDVNSRTAALTGDNILDTVCMIVNDLQLTGHVVCHGGSPQYSFLLFNVVELAGLLTAHLFFA